MHLVIDVVDQIHALQMDLIRMSNQDYDLDEIIYQYLEYRKTGDVDIRNYRMLSSALDNEDAEVLYIYTKRLYRELDELLIGIRQPIRNIRLSTNRQTVLVELT